jgi:hypothetical protein
VVEGAWQMKRGNPTGFRVAEGSQNVFVGGSAERKHHQYGAYHLSFLSGDDNYACSNCTWNHIESYTMGGGSPFIHHLAANTGTVSNMNLYAAQNPGTDYDISPFTKGENVPVSQDWIGHPTHPYPGLPDVSSYGAQR